MYYVIALILYILFILCFIIYIKKPDKSVIKNFKNVLTYESIKGLSKLDVKNRKKRVKVLPMYQRFLYWIWFTSIMIMIFAPTIFLCLIRKHLIEYFFIPNTAVYFESSSLSYLIFGIGSFFSGISLLVAYSYITNRGIIRKADLLYQMGSFQEYPKKMNILLSGLLTILGLPLMIISFNSYSYCTNDYIATKSSFSISESKYDLSDIDYILKSIYTNDKFDYTIVLKSGKRFEILDDSLGNNDLDNLFSNHQIRYQTQYLQ